MPGTNQFLCLAPTSFYAWHQPVFIDGSSTPETPQIADAMLSFDSLRGKGRAVMISQQPLPPFGSMYIYFPLFPQSPPLACKFSETLSRSRQSTNSICPYQSSPKTTRSPPALHTVRFMIYVVLRLLRRQYLKPRLHSGLDLLIRSSSLVSPRILPAALTNQASQRSKRIC